MVEIMKMSTIDVRIRIVKDLHALNGNYKTEFGSFNMPEIEN